MAFPFFFFRDRNKRLVNFRLLVKEHHFKSLSSTNRFKSALRFSAALWFLSRFLNVKC